MLPSSHHPRWRDSVSAEALDGARIAFDGSTGTIGETVCAAADPAVIVSTTRRYPALIY
jgi:hypothetical protein